MALVGQWGEFGEAFWHIPKCAGVSVRNWLLTHHPESLWVEVNGMHGKTKEPEKAFTVLRHPADWLMSFYAYYRQWDWEWDALPDIVEEQFEFAKGLGWLDFVDSVLDNNPGAVTKVFEYYCEPGVKVFLIEELDHHFPGIKWEHYTNYDLSWPPAYKKRFVETEASYLRKIGVYEEHPDGYLLRV